MVSGATIRIEAPFATRSWVRWRPRPGPSGEPATLLSCLSNCHPFIRHPGPDSSSRRLCGGLCQRRPWSVPATNDVPCHARTTAPIHRHDDRPAGVRTRPTVEVETDVSYSGADDPLPRQVPEATPLTTQRSTRTDDDRPPYCPVCRRRLVILTTHIDRTRSEPGQRHRYQLWGCPRGHATSRRIDGAFTAVDVLPDPLRQDDSYRLGESVQASLTRPGDGQMRGAGQLR